MHTISNNNKKVKYFTKELVKSLTDKQLYELISHLIKEYRERPVRLLVSEIRQHYPAIGRDRIAQILKLHPVTISRLYKEGK